MKYDSHRAIRELATLAAKKLKAEFDMFENPPGTHAGLILLNNGSHEWIADSAPLPLRIDWPKGIFQDTTLDYGFKVYAGPVGDMDAIYHRVIAAGLNAADPLMPPVYKDIAAHGEVWNKIS